MRRLLRCRRSSASSRAKTLDCSSGRPSIEDARSSETTKAVLIKQKFALVACKCRSAFRSPSPIDQRHSLTCTCLIALADRARACLTRTRARRSRSRSPIALALADRARARRWRSRSLIALALADRARRSPPTSLRSGSIGRARSNECGQTYSPIAS
jgi:hypothetical protein